MAKLRLSESEYELVRLLLEEDAPVEAVPFLARCRTRLWMEEAQVQSLMDGLVERGVLALSEDGLLSTLVSREAVEQTVLDRAFDCFDSQNAVRSAETPPEPERPPEPTSELQEPPQKRPFFRRNNPYLWIGAGILLLLAVAAGVVAGFLRAEQPYPYTLQFEDGRTFTMDVRPESDAQRAAVQLLMERARDQLFGGEPAYLTFEITGLEEYELSPDWADALFIDLYSSSTFPPEVVDADSALPREGDIASAHYGTVVFATVEQTCGTQTRVDSSSQYFDGGQIFRLYLSGSEEQGYTLSELCFTPAASCYEVQAETFEADGKTYDLSLWGISHSSDDILYGYGSSSIPVNFSQSYITLSDGETTRLLYLTETFSSWRAQACMVQDLNGDGYPDLVITPSRSYGYFTLCYLYDPELREYQLFSPLCGYGVEFDPAFPGMVQRLRYGGAEDVPGQVNIFSFERFSGQKDLEEVARMEFSFQAGDEDSSLYDYRYYLDGELVRQYQYDPYHAANQESIMSTVYWDRLMLEAAQRYGCLDLPTEPASDPGLSPVYVLLQESPEEGLRLYRTGNGLLMIDNHGQYHVLPISIWGTDLICSDLNGDGHSEIIACSYYSFPSYISQEEGQWTVQPLIDLNALAEDFTEHTTCHWEDDILTMTYDGQYGTVTQSMALSAAAAEAVYPGLTTSGDCIARIDDYPEWEFHEDSSTVSLTFPVYLCDEDNVAGPYFSYTIALAFDQDGPYVIAFWLAPND